MKFLKVFLFACIFLSTPSHAELYSSKTGLIKQIDVAAGNNRGFRVFLKDTPFECGSGQTYAYLNESASNYNTYVSVILAAKMSKTPIRIYNVAGSDNNCLITYLIMLDE